MAVDARCPNCSLRAPPTCYDPDKIPLFNSSHHFIPSELAQGYSALIELREKISEVERAIGHLQATKTQLESHLAKQTNCLAPVNRLPDDILLLVFRLACNLPLRKSDPHHADKESNQLLQDSRKGPWAIAAVSTRWRAFALSCAQLWTRVNYGRSFTDCDPTLRRLSLQLSRAGDSPVNLILDQTFHGEHRDCQCESELHTLRQHAHNVERLRIRYHHTSDSNDFMATESLGYTRLNALRIDGIGSQRMDIISFRNSPHLSRLFLHESAIAGPAFSSFIPWAKLVSLRLESCVALSVDKLLEVLGTTSQLVFLGVIPRHQSSEDDTEPEVPTIQTVNLPNLTAFQISFPRGDPISRLLLASIQAPSLERLHVSQVNAGDLGIILAFTGPSDFAPTTGASITAFSLHAPDLGTDDVGYTQLLYTTLRRMPSLRSLYFSHEDSPNSLLTYEGIVSYDGIIAEMTAPTPLLCPNLQELHLKGNTNIMISPSVLRTFVESRSRFRTANDGISLETNPSIRGFPYLEAVHLEEVRAVSSEALDGDIRTALAMLEDSLNPANPLFRWLDNLDCDGVLKYSNLAGSWDDGLDYLYDDMYIQRSP